MVGSSELVGAFAMEEAGPRLHGSSLLRKHQPKSECAELLARCSLIATLLELRPLRAIVVLSAFARVLMDHPYTGLSMIGRGGAKWTTPQTSRRRSRL